MSAPGTSRAERQAARDAANAAAYVSFTQAANQPGGGVNQPKYQTRGGPTWDPRWQSEFLKSNPNAVFDSRGNLIYNDADLGAAEVEAARAAQGLPPSYQTKGEPSGQYLNAVSQAGGDINKIKTKQRELESVRGEITQARRATLEKDKELIAERERLYKLIEGRNIDETWAGNRLDNINLELQGNISSRADYSSRLSNIDKARQTLAQEQRAAQSYQAKAAIASTKPKVTEGPRPIQNALAADYTQRLEASRPKPQRQRAQAQSGIETKLFVNPTFIQDAESFTRAPSFQGETRKERPKAQQGITDKLFVNPKYVTKEQQREKDKTKTITDWTLSLTEGITTERQAGTKNLAVSLTEGRPSAPKNLTQAEVDKMSPEQYAVYKAEIDSYNRFVTSENKRIKKENTESLNKSLRELKTFIDEQKAAGTKTIVINTDQGEKRVPIGEAYLAIQRTKNVKGIYTDQVIPAGYTVTGPLTSMNYVSEKPIQETTPKKTDPLSKSLEYLERYDPTVGPRGPEKLTEAQRQVRSFAPGVLLQLGSTASAFAGEVNKFKNTVMSPSTPILNVVQSERENPSIPDTPPNIAIGLPISKVIQGERSATKIVSETGSEISKSYEKLGAGKFSGAVVGGIIELGNPVKGLKQAGLKIKAGAKAIGSKIKLPEKPIESPLEVKFAKREGTKILEPIRAYPQSRLRNRGLESNPDITQSITPMEEIAIKKSYQIPRPPTSEITTQGARLATKPRDILENLPPRSDMAKPKPVESDPFYDAAQNIDRTRSGEVSQKVEPKIFKVETAKYMKGINPLSGIFEKANTLVQDLATQGKKPVLPTRQALEDAQRIRDLEKARLEPKPVESIENDIGYNPASNIPKTRAKEIKTYRVQTDQLFGKTVDPIRDLLSSRLAQAKNLVQDIGTTQGKKPVLPTRQPLEEAATITRLEDQRLQRDLLRNKIIRPDITKIDPLNKPKLEEGRTGLDISKKELTRLEDQRLQRDLLRNKIIRPDITKIDPLNKPKLEEGRTGLDISKEQITKLEKERLESITGRPVEEVFGFRPEALPKTRAKKIKTYRVQQEELFKADTAQPSPPSGKISQVLIQRQKPKRQLTPQEKMRGEVPPFKKEISMAQKPKRQLTTAEKRRGEIEGDWRKRALNDPIIKASITGGAGVGPAPLIGTALAEDSSEIPIGNSTQTNQTAPPILEEDIDSTPSALEPESMSAQRPVFNAVVGQRGFAGVDTGLGSRARERLGRVSASRSATRPALRSSVTTIPLFRQSQPQKQPQPQKQAQRLRQPFPNPMRQPQRLVQPEAFKQKELLKLKTPPPRPPKRLIFALPPTRRKEKREKRKKEELKPNDFLGNASQENISSNYSRQEIILGIKRTAKIERNDLAKERKGVPRFVNTSTNPMLSRTKPGLLRKEKKALSL